MSKALLLVDLQNDFFPGGALAAKDADLILPVIAKLVEYPWDVIIATKDWHPVDHCSFAASHGKKVGEKVFLSGLEQILWPVHCVQNSWGAEFVPGWNSKKVDMVFYKGVDKEIDSYSAFFDNGHQRSTGLKQFLHEKNINEVYIAGLVTDFCVKYSALDACRLGFQVTVIKDGCSAVNLQHGDEERAFAEMQKEGAHLITIKQLYTIL